MRYLESIQKSLKRVTQSQVPCARLELPVAEGGGCTAARRRGRTQGGAAAGPAWKILGCILAHCSSIVLLSGAQLVHAQPNPALIRVAVAKDDPQVLLQIFGRFTMVASHNGQPIQQGRRLRPVTVRAVAAGLAMGDDVLPFAGVRIEPATDAAISLNGKRLRGIIEIMRQRDLTLLVVNHVELEDYLRGVLSKEAPDYWPPEALKAIAIAARTYALYQRFTKSQIDYDVSGDIMSQDYGGKTAEKIATTRAVKSTAGWIVMSQGKLFPTFYHSTCGGMTENGRVMGPFNIEPLRGGVTCRFCLASPFFSWQRRLTKADVAWAVSKSRFGSIGPVGDIQVTKRTASGRVEELRILGARRTLVLSGYDFRSLFGFDRIRSPLFAVERVADGFVLDGHGWGHGVGMCQWGAAELARRGFSAAEILEYYYPNTQLVDVQTLVNQPVTVVGGS
ncbi:MAG: SpoIID/LytB domain-containing protein [Candidatus Omnitrophica bacterium]|nr:SpoIID/LytB domain-containing protein [Candidatus Omnitrophota bacterium]